MATITHTALVDNGALADRIQNWFDERSFETKKLESDNCFAVKARKSSAWRAVLAADRALEVNIRTFNGATEVDVRQGDWTTNLVSNGVWLVATGGMNLGFTAWSIVIQKQLEAFIRNTLMEMSEGVATS